MLPVRTPPVYSHAELRSDAVVHIAGILAALIAAPVLVILSVVWIGDAGTVSATLVYAICLVAMLVCSALYNTISPPGRKDLFRRIDQSAIYLKIAGTYTPFAVLTGAHAGPLLAGVWGAALAEAVQQLKTAFTSSATSDREGQAILLHGLTTADAGDFAFAKRLYRERTTLSTSGLLHLALALVLLDRKSMAEDLLNLVNLPVEPGTANSQVIDTYAGHCVPWMQSNVELRAL
jgi:hypothetical protein